jgi:hypothetical protein
MRPAAAPAAQGCMAQCRRALRPDGLFLAALWGGDTLQELRIAHAAAEQELEGGLSPRVSPLAQARHARLGMGLIKPPAVRVTASCRSRRRAPRPACCALSRPLL